MCIEQGFYDDPEWMDYLVYCEAKREIGEKPLTFEQWLELNGLMMG